MTMTEADKYLAKRMEDLNRSMTVLETTYGVEIPAVKSALAELRLLLTVVSDREHERGQRVAALEERCKALEKQADRHWSLWLAAGAALVSVVSVGVNLLLRKSPP